MDEVYSCNTWNSVCLLGVSIKYLSEVQTVIVHPLLIFVLLFSPKFWCIIHSCHGAFYFMLVTSEIRTKWRIADHSLQLKLNPSFCKIKWLSRASNWGKKSGYQWVFWKKFLAHQIKFQYFCCNWIVFLESHKFRFESFGLNFLKTLLE